MFEHLQNIYGRSVTDYYYTSILYCSLWECWQGKKKIKS